MGEFSKNVFLFYRQKRLKLVKVSATKKAIASDSSLVKLEASQTTSSDSPQRKTKLLSSVIIKLSPIKDFLLETEKPQITETFAH